MAKDKQNDLQVLKSNPDAPAILGFDPFASPNFKALEQTVDTIASYTGQLTDGEKKQGVQIIEDWTKLTHETVENHLRKINTILCFLGKKQIGYHTAYISTDLTDDESIDLDVESRLARLSATVTEYQDFLTKRQAVIDLEDSIKGTSLFNFEDNPDKSYTENAKDEAENTLKEVEYGIKHRRLLKVAKASRDEWIRLMLTNQNLKAFIREITKRANGLVDYERKINTTASVAKLNVSIASSDMRDTLKELFKFTESL